MNTTLFPDYVNSIDFDRPLLSFPLYVGYDGFNYIFDNDLTWYYLDSDLNFFDADRVPLSADLSFLIRWYLDTLFYKIKSMSFTVASFNTSVDLLFTDPNLFYSQHDPSVYAYGTFKNIGSK